MREYAREKVLYSIDTFDREEREERTTQVLADVTAHFSEEYEDGEEIIADVLYDMTKEAVRTRIIEEGVRPDGRALTEIAPYGAKSACSRGRTGRACSPADRRR